MRDYNVDLHIHSPYSLGVSSQMTVPHMVETAKKKGIDILGTGDVTQPDWLRHLRTSLTQSDDILSRDAVFFVPTVEVEDLESIHHIIVMPSLNEVDDLRDQLRRYSPNIDHRWGGRPRINLYGEELAGIVRDTGGIVGPAHAFTPFKSIFREGRHDSLKSCYGEETRNICFLELGLSADSDVADHIPELAELTFITSSDAHSPTADRLGRESTRLRMEAPQFEELRKALRRENGRRAVMNIGVDPRMGKYYLSFCSSCRRTAIFSQGEDPPRFDDLNIYFSATTPDDVSALVRAIHARRVRCPACGKNIRLGVRDRAVMLGRGESIRPEHRPPFLHIPPLIELISVALNMKKSSLRVRQTYDLLIANMGPEYDILTGGAIEKIHQVNPRIAYIIQAYRDGSVRYCPGGGGRYGTVLPSWEATEQ